jgi:hypothetical protein
LEQAARSADTAMLAARRMNGLISLALLNAYELVVRRRGRRGHTYTQPPIESKPAARCYGPRVCTDRGMVTNSGVSAGVSGIQKSAQAWTNVDAGRVFVLLRPQADPSRRRPAPCPQRSASGLTCTSPRSGFPSKNTGFRCRITSCSNAERARDEVSSRVRWKVALVRGGSAG